MNDDIEMYSELWAQGAQDKYRLVDLSGVGKLERCVIFSLEFRTAKIISDPVVATEVKRRMAAAGVPVVTDLPPG